MARYYGFPVYVPAAERRRLALKELASMKKRGAAPAPVEISGRKIATTFWGEAWCTNLEAYSDYGSRLPRGRTYVRNGSVLDLQIDSGRVRSVVSGSELYTISIVIEPLRKKTWSEIKKRCGGQIASLVELLRGSISERVMEIVSRKGEGLFPSPREISLECSCPDWAVMCKHVAASLYGVGARLDQQPELLFKLRGVDPQELVEAAVASPVGTGAGGGARRLATSELSSLFGVDIDVGSADGAGSGGSKRSGRARGTPKRAQGGSRTKKKVSKKKVSKKKVSKKKVSKKKASKKKAKR